MHQIPLNANLRCNAKVRGATYQIKPKPSSTQLTSSNLQPRVLRQIYSVHFEIVEMSPNEGAVVLIREINPLY